MVMRNALALEFNINRRLIELSELTLTPTPFLISGLLQRTSLHAYTLIPAEGALSSWGHHVICILRGHAFLLWGRSLPRNLWGRTSIHFAIRSLPNTLLR